MSDDVERDDDGQEEEESDVYLLDLEEGEAPDVDEATRRALDAVSRPRARDAEGVEPAAEREAMIAELEKELDELRDRSLRTQADFENFRRRTEQERGQERRRGVADTLRELLPVLDNLERALVSSGSAEDLKAGVEMIVRQLRELLRQQGVEAIAAFGKPFDPTVHDAVASEEDPEVEVATVAEELQRGYTIEGRLLRPAMVRVAVPGVGADDDGRGGTSG